LRSEAEEGFLADGSGLDVAVALLVVAVAGASGDAAQFGEGEVVAAGEVGAEGSDSEEEGCADGVPEGGRGGAGCGQPGG
jgi:hypothetical protein